MGCLLKSRGQCDEPGGGVGEGEQLWKREEYLQILTDQIRCRMARDAVKEEYCAHIEDQMQTS